MDNDSVSFGYQEIKLDDGWEEGQGGGFRKFIPACTLPAFVIINTVYKLKIKNAEEYNNCGKKKFL